MLATMECCLRLAEGVVYDLHGPPNGRSLPFSEMDFKSAVRVPDGHSCQKSKNPRLPEGLMVPAAGFEPATP